MTERLSADRLVFAYPRLPLFDGWSHDFAAGLTWVRGENGCGKSTLLQLLGGALEPASGTLRVGTIDAKSDPLEYRRRVYWCGPDGVAFDHLRPAEFFGFVAGLYPTFDHEVVGTWIEAFGLEGFMPRRIDQLSTGTRRKVAVIAAMATGSDVVILDEPLAGLDQSSLAVFRRHLEAEAAKRDRIWIVASHEPLGAAEREATLVDLPRRA